MDRHRPALSVILPVYNAQATVAAAIASVLDNTAAELELICIDDGSTDGSAAVLDTLAASEPRLRVLRLPVNAGVSAARNAGLDAARGDYLSFLDADDTVVPGALDVLMAVAIAHQADLAIGIVLYLDGPACALPLAPPQASREAEVTTLRESTWLQSGSGHHCGNFYRRQLIEDGSLRFAGDLALGEDQLFQAAAMLAAVRIALIDDTVYLYHQFASGSLTRSAPTLKLLCDHLEWRRRTRQLFLDADLPQPARALMTSWSYPIRSYWLQLPGALDADSASLFFTRFRALIAACDVEPWTAATAVAERRLLECILAGEDARAFSLLAGMHAK